MSISPWSLSLTVFRGLSRATPDNPIHHPTTYSYIKGSKTYINTRGIRPPDYETSWDYHAVSFPTSLKLQINASVYIFLFTLAAAGMLLCVCIAKKKSYIFGLQRIRSEDIAMTPRDRGRKLAWFGGSTETSWDGQSLSVSFTFSAVQGVLTHSIFTYSREEKVGAL